MAQKKNLNIRVEQEMIDNFDLIAGYTGSSRGDLVRVGLLYFTQYGEIFDKNSGGYLSYSDILNKAKQAILASGKTCEEYLQELRSTRGQQRSEKETSVVHETLEELEIHVKRLRKEWELYGSKER